MLGNFSHCLGKEVRYPLPGVPDWHWKWLVLVSDNVTGVHKVPLILNQHGPAQDHHLIPLPQSGHGFEGLICLRSDIRVLECGPREAGFHGVWARGHPLSLPSTLQEMQLFNEEQPLLHCQHITPGDLGQDEALLQFRDNKTLQNPRKIKAPQNCLPEWKEWNLLTFKGLGAKNGAACVAETAADSSFHFKGSVKP